MAREPEQSEKTTYDEAVSLFLQYYNFVRLIAFESAPAYDLVDDIVNDCFVAFVSTPEKWDLSCPVQPLLRKITKNIALQHWKKRVHTLPSALREVAEILRERCENMSSEENETNLTLKLQALESCMNKLTNEQKLLLEDHYIESKTFVELEQKYQRRAGTLQRAVSRLRISIERCVRKFFIAKGEKL